MRKSIQRLSLLTVLAVLLALCLLATAGPALAGGPVITTHGTFLGMLDEGTIVPSPPDEEWGHGWTPYMVQLDATGPEGWRCLGYGVVALDVKMQGVGDDLDVPVSATHNGPIAFLTVDPSTFWVAGTSFEDNLAAVDSSSLLWVGTWDGYTLNNRNHIVTLTMEGRNANSGWTATVHYRMNLFSHINCVWTIEP